jgi:hypothetical protein
MKYVKLFIVFCILFSGCSSYYYKTIKIPYEEECQVTKIRKIPHNYKAIDTVTTEYYIEKSIDKFDNVTPIMKLPNSATSIKVISFKDHSGSSNPKLGDETSKKIFTSLFKRTSNRNFVFREIDRINNENDFKSIGNIFEKNNWFNNKIQNYIISYEESENFNRFDPKVDIIIEGNVISSDKDTVEIQVIVADMINQKEIMNKKYLGALNIVSERFAQELLYGLRYTGSNSIKELKSRYEEKEVTRTYYTEEAYIDTEIQTKYNIVKRYDIGSLLGEVAPYALLPVFLFLLSLPFIHGYLGW